MKREYIAVEIHWSDASMHDRVSAGEFDGLVLEDHVTVGMLVEKPTTVYKVALNVSKHWVSDIIVIPASQVTVYHELNKPLNKIGDKVK